MNRRGQLVAFLARFISHTSGSICGMQNKYGAITYLLQFSIFTPTGTVLKISDYKASNHEINETDKGKLD